SGWPWSRRKALCAANPPYTPDEVRRWAEIVKGWNIQGTPGLGLLEKTIGQVRAPSPSGGTHHGYQGSRTGDSNAARVAEQRRATSRSTPALDPYVRSADGQAAAARGPLVNSDGRGE